MFYFSKGLLKECLMGGSLFNESKGRLDRVKEELVDSSEDRFEYKTCNSNINCNESARIQWRDNLRPLIIKIEDTFDMSTQNKSHNSQVYQTNTLLKNFFSNMHFLILNDGSNASVLGAIRNDKINHLFENGVSDNHGLEKGSVVLISEYTLFAEANKIVNGLRLEEFTKTIEDSLLKLPVFNIESMILLGKDDKQTFEEKQQKEPEVTIESNNISSTSSRTNIVKNENEQQRSYQTIANLNPSMSNKSEWTIKAILANMTGVREFENRQNGQKGKIMRLQFYDQSGFIEAAFFNDFCDKWHGYFQKDKCYIIKNCQIKYVKNNLRAWPDSVNSNFDLVVVNNSTFVEDPSTTNFNIVAAAKSSNKQDNNDDDDDDGDVNDDLEKKSLGSKIDDKPKSTFIQLNELLFKKNESLIDTMGIVIKINELNSINRSGKGKLSLRRIEIVDESISTPISVALWGKQAEECPFKVGNMYLFKTIKLTNFKGISLSVIRPTGYMDVTGMYNVSGVEKLSMWWRKNKRSFLSDQDQSKDESDRLSNASKKQKT